MEEGGTYLEDFLLSLELLPNDMRRDFELMKDLDKECIELNRELMEVENAYIDSQVIIKKRKFDAPDENTLTETEALKKSSEQYLDKINTLRVLARQKLAEKTAIVLNMGSIIERFSRKLDTDLAFFETDLKGCGEFETPKGAEPGSEVAFSLSPDVPVLSIPAVGYSRTLSMQSNMSVMGNSSSNLVRLVDPAIAEKSMILGRVICYRADTGEYDILDVDDSKKYVLPERQVVVLDLLESQRKLSKGELVFALYPDTTSFYPAVVSHAPRRTAMGAEPSVIVQFCGDEEIDTGLTPDRTVPLKYVVRMAEPSARAGTGGPVAAAGTGQLLSRSATANSSSNTSLANMTSF